MMQEASYFAAVQTGGPWEVHSDRQPTVPSPRPPLSPEQTAHFKHFGFVILPGFVEQGVVGVWREQFWAAMNGERQRPDTWDVEQNKAAAARLQLQPSLIRLPQMVAAAAQLGDGKLRQLGQGGRTPATTWPFHGDRQPAQSGHVDGYGNPEDDWTGGLFLNATCYVEDVSPCGGGFTYWPRSHLPVPDFFRRHPTTIDGSFHNLDGWGTKNHPGFYESDPSTMRGTGDGVEFVAAAGDVILWHKFLAHSASMNSCAASPRIVPNRPGEKAGRTSYATHIEPLDSPLRGSQLRYTVARDEDPWRHWGRAVREALSLAPPLATLPRL